MAALGDVGFVVGGLSSGYQPFYSGAGTISGTLQENGVSCNAEVFLFYEQFDLMIDYVIANGSFSFPGLKTTNRYTVIANDITSSNYNKMIYRNITPS